MTTTPPRTTEPPCGQPACAICGNRVPTSRPSLVDIAKMRIPARHALLSAYQHFDALITRERGLVAALQMWSDSIYLCPLKSCHCVGGYHMRRITAEMAERTRDALSGEAE